MPLASRRLPAALALASAAALAGCGGGADATDPLAAGPAPVAAPAPVIPATPVAVGEELRPGPRTPAAVARALRRQRVLVIGFVLSRPQDDRASAHAIARLRRSGPGASGVDYFVYRVDRTRSFGDLPELLAVEDTPTVAVIGGDGRLRNRFQGWADAGTLRQAVAAAKDGDAREATGGHAGAPTGSRAGIALARRVNARYASVPGVRMAGSAIDDRLGPAEITIEARLRDGRVTGWSGRLSVGTRAIEMATASGALRARSAGAACWAGIPASDSVVGVGEPMITLAGARVAAPRREGGRVVLAVTTRQGDRSLRGAYRIDPRASRVLAVEAPALSVTVTDLVQAPVAAPAQPLCAQPAEAFPGMGETATP